MTFKDKPRRPGGKPSERDGKSPARKFAKPAASAAKAGPKPEKPAVKPERAKTAPAATSSVDHGGKPERISKIMARVGVASRRDIERMIMEGRVSLNGKVLDSPVVNATLADKIEVDGVAIRGIERTRLWLYHKPAGLVTTNSDPEGRPTVFDNLPDELPRVLSIGRLDINTEGLLLLTNDGGLSRVLELPTTGWLRRYRVRAYGEVDQDALDKLKEGVAVEGVLYGGIEATLDRKQGHNVWITMGLREGKNREIKNVLGALGLEVNRLIRISYGPFQLGDLPEGKVVEVRGRMLRDQLGPRLIDEAKANFDAPIYGAAAVEEDEDTAAKKGGSWKAEKPRAEKQKTERPARGRQEDWGDRRERALGRLDTRRDDDAARGKPFKRGQKDERGASEDDRPKRRPELGHSRRANVWMAPGARPVAEKKADRPQGEEATEKRVPRARPAGAPQSKRYGRGRDEQPQKSRGKFDPDRKSAGRSAPDRAEGPPRVTVSRTRDEGGEWIRAETPARTDGPRGGKSFGDKPRGDRPRGDGPRGEGPSGRKSFGAKPRGDMPRGDRPAGAKSFGARSNDKPAGGKPRGDRSDGNGPRGGSGKPSGKGVTRGADRRR